VGGRKREKKKVRQNGGAIEKMYEEERSRLIICDN